MPGMCQPRRPRHPPARGKPPTTSARLGPEGGPADWAETADWLREELGRPRAILIPVHRPGVWLVAGEPAARAEGTDLP